jgi:hypothetical protein
MAQAGLLIDSVRAGAEGNQELFRRALEGLVSEWAPSNSTLRLFHVGRNRSHRNPMRQQGPVTIKAGWWH